MGRTGAAFVFNAALLASVQSDAGQQATSTVLVNDLHRPSGIAVRPGDSGAQHEIYFALADLGEVRRFRTGTPDEVTTAITGLPRGRIHLSFLDRNRLVVVVAATAQTPSLLVFELKDGTSQSADEAVQKLGLGENVPAAGEDAISVQSLTRTIANDRVADQLIVAAQSSNRPAELWKLPIRAGTLDKPAKFVPASGDSSAAALAISNQGFVVLASSSIDGGERGSRLTFFSPMDGKQVMELPLDLNDIRALTYGPRSRNLYAASYGGPSADSNSESSGIFRIDDAGKPGQPAARAVNIAAVPRPVAIAFAPDGALYVSSEGDSESPADKSGRILRLSGNL
jgi:hypothetical protein